MALSFLSLLMVITATRPRYSTSKIEGDAIFAVFTEVDLENKVDDELKLKLLE